MKWALIQKILKTELEGNYKNPAVKEHLRQEGGYRCVYCAVGEAKLGGIRAFHVEHYKPKSRDEFKHLEHALSNLFYACPICNSFKSNTWPAEPTASFDVASYPDPSSVDYSILFTIHEDGKLEGVNEAAKYVVSQLYLNRTQLILERRQFALDGELAQLRQEQDHLIKALKAKDDKKATEYYQKILETNPRIIDLLLELQNIPLYEPNDIRRQR